MRKRKGDGMMREAYKLQHQSFSEQVLEQLMDWVMDGKIHMGQKLNAEEIAQTLGVSRMPVREALKNLEKMGLVEWVPYTGARMVEVTKRDVQQIYIMRRAIEPVAAFHACKVITDEQIEIIEDIQCRFEKELARDVPRAKEIYLLNREFHFAIYSVCDMDRICAWIKTLWDNLAFFKLIYGITYVNDKTLAVDKIEEHRCYIDLLKARDAEKLRQLIDQNLQRHEVDVPYMVLSYVDDHNEK